MERPIVPVPFIDIKRFEPDFLPAWQAKVAEMSAQAQFIGGAEVARLESRLAQATGVAHAITCGNGTDAIQLALRAVGVGAGDVVLVPNATFWATFEAVVNVGASPVTVDVDPADGAVDFDAFTQALDAHAPKAALVVHLYG
ncbi:MAG: aminotransferase class I/II-fold pyridoxal phosphate-dependent enzyme, partial [Burkholderiaceae bacterium]